MGVTNLDQLGLGTRLANTELANPNAEETLHFFLAGTVAAGAKKAGAIVGKAGTITDVRAYADTAPVGAAMVLDVHKNGVTVFTSQAARPTIADGANASSTTAPAVTAVAAGDRLTIDADQVGSGTAGADVYISITMKRAHAA